jgi:hypothetical protein
MKKNYKKPALLVSAILFTAIGLLTTTGNALAQSKSLQLEDATPSGYINPPNAKNESFLVLFTDIRNIEITADANGIDAYHYDNRNGAYVVSFHAPAGRSAKSHQVTLRHPDYNSYTFRFSAQFDTGQFSRIVLNETKQRSSILSEALSNRGGASTTSRQQQPRANDSQQSILSGAIASGDVERRHQLNEAERERQRIEAERQRREAEERRLELNRQYEEEMRAREERGRREREATSHINHEVYQSEDRNIQTAIGIMNAVASAHQQNQQTLNRQQTLAREMTNRLNQQHQAQQQREERERLARQRQAEERHRQEQNRQIQQQEARQRQIEQDRRDREAQQQQQQNRNQSSVSTTASSTASQTPQRQISLVNRNQNNGQNSSGNTSASAVERTGTGTECTDRSNPQWPAGKYSSGVFEVDGIGGMVSPGGPRTYHYGRIENYETDGCGNGWVRYEIRYQINPPAARPYSRERLAESGERFIISVGRRIANMLDNDINNHRYVIDQTRTIDSHVGMQEKDGRIYTTSVTGSIWIKATWLRN